MPHACLLNVRARFGWPARKHWTYVQYIGAIERLQDRRLLCPLNPGALSAKGSYAVSPNWTRFYGDTDKYHSIRMGNEALERVRRRQQDTIPDKLNLQLKWERKLLTIRQHELTDFQWLAVSGWLNNFLQLKTAYKLKERYFKIWDCSTQEEALAEYLRWQESIPDDLAKPFRAITKAWRTWHKQILAYFEYPITNAFTESFNSKIWKMYQEGNGYSFEFLPAKVLFSDILQKKARKVEQVKVKKRARFDDVPQQLRTGTPVSLSRSLSYWRDVWV